MVLQGPPQGRPMGKSFSLGAGRGQTGALQVKVCLRGQCTAWIQTDTEVLRIPRCASSSPHPSVCSVGLEMLPGNRCLAEASRIIGTGHRPGQHHLGQQRSPQILGVLQWRTKHCYSQQGAHHKPTLRPTPGTAGTLGQRRRHRNTVRCAAEPQGAGGAAGRAGSALPPCSP